MEEERPPAQRPNPRRNPYRQDPTFETCEERDRFVDSCNIVKTTAVPVRQPMLNICTCEKCENTIEWKKTPAGSYEHICCQQMKTWQEIDSNVQCVTDSEAYIAVTNRHAVQNVMLLCKQELSDQGLELHKPPSNDNWRFGCYKTKDYLITKKICNKKGKINFGPGWCAISRFNKNFVFIISSRGYIWMS